MPFKIIQLLFVVTVLASCQTSYEVSTIPTGNYTFEHPSIPNPSKGVFVEDYTDSLQITIDTGNTIYISLQNDSSFTLSKISWDADVFTVPFKIRPSYNGLPPQLDANFHVAFYMGRRHDFYKTRLKKAINEKKFRITKGTGFGYGLFVGIADATIRPEFMNYKINYEYEGISLNTGVATIIDIGAVNVGLALGFDKLIDKNNSNWIYQHKPWFGVLLGFNLN